LLVQLGVPVIRVIENLASLKLLLEIDPKKGILKLKFQEILGLDSIFSEIPDELPNFCLSHYATSKKGNPIQK